MRAGLLSILLILPSFAVETWGIKPASQCAGYENDISELVFRYEFRECRSSLNSQEASGNFFCDDFLYSSCESGDLVRMSCSGATEDTKDGATNLFIGFVSKAETFTLDLRNVPISVTKLQCSIRNPAPKGRICQNFALDISGDVNLTIGDDYGSIELTECTIGEARPRPGSPTSPPTKMPTVSPTKSPTQNPTTSPTRLPTKSPTTPPTPNPTALPTKQPTKAPTTPPTPNPTSLPTKQPTKVPTRSPTPNPTASPTKLPTKSPTRSPTRKPTPSPTKSPSASPSVEPTTVPSLSPSLSQFPTRKPTEGPTSTPSSSPSQIPSVLPTNIPSWNPTSLPSFAPSISQQPSLSMLPTITKKKTEVVKGEIDEFGQLTKCLTDPTTADDNSTAERETPSFRQYNFKYSVSVRGGSNIDKIVSPIQDTIHRLLSSKYIHCNFDITDNDDTRARRTTRVERYTRVKRSLGYDEIEGLGIFEISSLPQDRVSSADECDSQQTSGNADDDCYIVDAAMSISNIGTVDNTTLQSTLDTFLKEEMDSTNSGSTVSLSHGNITSIAFVEESSKVVTGNPTSRGEASGIQDSNGNVGNGGDSISIIPIIVGVVVFGGVIIGALLIRRSRNRQRRGVIDYMKHTDEASRVSGAELDAAISESIAPSSIYLEDEDDTKDLVLVGEDSFLGASYAFNDEKEKAVAILSPTTTAAVKRSTDVDYHATGAAAYPNYDDNDFRSSWVPDSVNDDSTRCSGECVEIVDASMHSSREMMEAVSSLAAPKIKQKSRVYIASDTVDL